MLKNAKTQWATYLDQMQQDAEESGVNAVENTPAPSPQNDTAAMTAKAKNKVAAFLNGRNGQKKEGKN